MGALFSLLTALLWSIGVISFKKSLATVDPFGLNLIKNVLAFALLAGTTAALGDAATLPPFKDLLIIAGSGAVGIGVSDTLYFMALQRMGASRTAIVACLYSPFVILFSTIMLGESLTPAVGTGGVLILGSVVVSGQRGFGLLVGRRQFWIGCVLGVLAMATVGFAVVVVKPLLQTYPLAWLSSVRMAGGLVSLLMLLPLHPNRGAVYAGFRLRSAWKWIFAGAFFGSYLSLVSWLAGFKYSQAGVAALLNQTSSVFIVLLAWLFLKEPMTRIKLIAVAMAFAGVALIAS